MDDLPLRHRCYALKAEKKLPLALPVQKRGTASKHLHLEACRQPANELGTGVEGHRIRTTIQCQRETAENIFLPPGSHKFSKFRPFLFLLRNRAADQLQLDLIKAKPLKDGGAKLPVYGR